MSYKTEVLAKEDVIWITFKLGFRVAPRINLLFRKVVEEMVKNKEVNIISRYNSLDKHSITGDFKFVVIQRFLSFENELSISNNFILKAYFLFKKFSLPDEKEYGLDYSNVTIEKSPLILSPPKNINLVRE
jgi:KUP system potassium uptake protein